MGLWKKKPSECDSCHKKSDILIPLYLLRERGDEEEMVLRYYCPDCFYIATNPIHALSVNPIDDAAHSIIKHLKAEDTEEDAE